MSVKIKIPASEISSLKNGRLTVENEGRCFRCDSSPADHYESHHLKYRVGMKKNRIYSNKFEFSRSYWLKIAICESCYQSDFLLHPDLLDRDGSPLARVVQFHSTTSMLGGLLAALGFLLLTPFIPETGLLAPLKQIWQLPVVIGVIALLLSWLSQRKYHNRVLTEFEKNYPGIQSHARAGVITRVVKNEKDASEIILEIDMENESWAIEAAKAHNWSYETNPTESEKTTSQKV